MAMALTLLAVVLTGLSFATGALRTRPLAGGWQLSAFDTRGQRRFALTLSMRERPDIAIFDSRGRRLLAP